MRKNLSEIEIEIRAEELGSLLDRMESSKEIAESVTYLLVVALIQIRLNELMDLIGGYIC